MNLESQNILSWKDLYGLSSATSCSLQDYPKLMILIPSTTQFKIQYFCFTYLTVQGNAQESPLTSCTNDSKYLLTQKLQLTKHDSFPSIHIVGTLNLSLQECIQKESTTHVGELSTPNIQGTINNYRVNCCHTTCDARKPTESEQTKFCSGTCQHFYSTQNTTHLLRLSHGSKKDEMLSKSICNPPEDFLSNTYDPKVGILVTTHFINPSANSYGSNRTCKNPPFFCQITLNYTPI